jgi:hypothetical protein
MTTVPNTPTQVQDTLNRLPAVQALYSLAAQNGLRLRGLDRFGTFGLLHLARDNSCGRLDDGDTGSNRRTRQQSEQATTAQAALSRRARRDVRGEGHPADAADVMHMQQSSGTGRVEQVAVGQVDDEAADPAVGELEQAFARCRP